jgi:hypothetical protein
MRPQEFGSFAVLIQLTQDAPHTALWFRTELTFPDTDHAVSQQPQSFRNHEIPSAISRNLSNPVGSISPGNVAAAWTTMKETSINENCDVSALKHKIRLPNNIAGLRSPSADMVLPQQ